MLLPQEARPGPCRSKRTQENLLARTSWSPCLWCLVPDLCPQLPASFWSCLEFRARDSIQAIASQLGLPGPVGILKGHSCSSSHLGATRSERSHASTHSAAPWVHQDANFFPFPDWAQCRTIQLPMSPPRMWWATRAVLLRVSCWMVMNASWKAMIRVNDGEKIRKQGSDPSHFNSPGKLWS